MLMYGVVYNGGSSFFNSLLKLTNQKQPKHKFNTNFFNLSLKLTKLKQPKHIFITL